MKWVKANERLPNNDKLKNICGNINSNFENLRFFDDKFHVFISSYGEWVSIVSDHEYVQWLDETPSEEPNQDELLAELSTQLQYSNLDGDGRRQKVFNWLKTKYSIQRK